MNQPNAPQNRKYSTDKAPERAATKRIVLPLNSERYAEMMECQKQAKILIDQQVEVHPELFPEEISKGYKATTVAQDCVLGAAVTTAADTAQLKEGYGVFK